MSQVVSRREAVRQQVLSLYGPVQEEMNQVEELLQNELRSDDSWVDELVKYGFRISGKRLRPALLLLVGKAVGRITPDHVVLAAVVEMIHTATLIHDDVLDEADLRRHLDTVNARFSNESSVLLGDYLFTHAFYLASTLGSTYACRTIGQSTNIVCEGELRQVHHSGNYELAEEEYFRIIDAKTAELTACCCRLGAHYSGASPQLEESMSRFGRDLGIAFQIADDLLDVVGNEATTGKSLGTDLEKRKATLPLIHMLSLASPDDRKQMLAVLSDPENHGRESLMAWLDRYHAIDYAREKARSYARRAVAALDQLPATPALTVLKNLTEFVVARSQ